MALEQRISDISLARDTLASEKGCLELVLEVGLGTAPLCFHVVTTLLASGVQAVVFESKARTADDSRLLEGIIRCVMAVAHLT